LVTISVKDLPKDDEEDLTKALLYTEDVRNKLGVAIRDTKKVPSPVLKEYLEDTVHAWRNTVKSRL
jgi:hypothetical protein